MSNNIPKQLVVAATDDDFRQNKNQLSEKILLFKEDGTPFVNGINSQIDSVQSDLEDLQATVDGLVDLDAMVFKGVIDCSANPNYPAGDSGDTYRISVAGKIGGASGVNVEIGDLAICITDGSVSGNQATVGSHWAIVQSNIDGSVIGPSSSTDSAVALFDGTTGKLLKSGGALGTAGALSSDTDDTLAANSDSRVATQKALKTYTTTNFLNKGSFKGEYSSTYNGGAGYSIGDIVSFNGGLYRAAVDSLVYDPQLCNAGWGSSTDWEVISYGNTPGLPGPASTGFLIGPRNVASLTTMSPGATTSATQQKMVFTPLHVFNSKQYSAFGFEITTANAQPGVVRSGLYAADGLDGRPGTYLTQNISQVSATLGVKSIGFDAGTLRLFPGLYWVGTVFQGLNTGGTNPQLRAAVPSMLLDIPGGTAIPASGAFFGYWTTTVVGSPPPSNPTCTFNTTATQASAAVPLVWLTAA